MQRRAVFLDRDGVLNAAIVKNNKPYPPSSLDELHIPNDVNIALSILRNAGFILIGATNQPDVARGTTPRSLVEAINDEIMKVLPLSEIRVCYHDDADKCECRKPGPGLLLDAANDYSIDLANSIMIGDRWKDVEAGQRAGCKTIWLKQNYDEKAPEQVPDYVATSIVDAAEWVVRFCSFVSKY